jgi:hypothetical protein
MTRNTALLEQPLIKDLTSPPVEHPTRIPYWTDDRSDLLSLLSSEEGSFLRWLQGL